MIAPGYEKALVPLVRMRILRKAYAEAESLLEVGRQTGLDMNVYWAHRAWIAQSQGHQSHARDALARIDEAARSGDARVASTLQLMSQSGREPTP